MDSTLLHDAPRAVVPEKLVQLIWAHQRLQRDSLQCLDGRQVTVLHPGFWNREAGPDFRRALLQFAGESPRTGDIEIDLQPGGWTQHRHQNNPRYRGVILHVVWKRPITLPACTIPTLPIADHLDAPMEELRHWLLDSPASPPLIAGQCTAPLQDLPKDSLTRLLQQAAEVRFHLKAHEFLARARTAGWDQALWEGLFASLGYKQNPWPLRRLAELRLRWIKEENGKHPTAETIERRLLGIGGLIPPNPEKLPEGAAGFTRNLWDAWWHERSAFDDVLLPKDAWQWNGIRPANHPQRRIALASRWLAEESFVAKIERWIGSTIPTPKLGSTLLELLSPEEESFWNRHWTLKSRESEQFKPWLGAQRAAEIAMNVLLPWAWMRARLGHNERLQNAISARYFDFPSAGSNTVLRLAQERLFGGKSACFARRASLQQGVLQIVKDFCGTTDSICTRCRFPELVRSLAGEPG